MKTLSPSVRHPSTEAGDTVLDDRMDARVFDIDPLGAEARILPHLMTAQLQSTASFLFSYQSLQMASSCDFPETSCTHDDILRAQSLLLAKQATTLRDVLRIDDIYAHPLIRRDSILSGHRIRSFAGAPLRGPQEQLIGVICTADTTARWWTDRDIRIVRRIVAQFEARRLSQP
ncbi:GAF domain-containing protein [uncultured Roseobacter sp.]|uniref:GAF domain-containing protein n=1 Tax=uncultured Roseobacter sp. TaxID=114847 RepID=UPI0026225042|nr:GAF domain-containing protein [uncultured Roseobacter sp.]